MSKINSANGRVGGSHPGTLEQSPRPFSHCQPLASHGSHTSPNDDTNGGDDSVTIQRLDQGLIGSKPSSRNLIAADYTVEA